MHARIARSSARHVASRGCDGDAPAPAASTASSAPLASAAAEEVARESARLNEWLNARFEEGLDFSPLAKTQLGRKDDYDRIVDLSEAAGEAQRAWMRESVAGLEREFDRDRLDPEARPLRRAARERNGWIRRPGQATACMIGMLKILELREPPRTALDNSFDIRAFHDVILGGGALSLEILERRVDDWIASERS